MELRIPNITATDLPGQLAQVKSFLVQLIHELNWALSTVSSGRVGNDPLAEKPGQAAAPAAGYGGASALSFQQIKALIIKSTDILDAYYEKIEAKIASSEKYVLQEDFGPSGVAKYIQDTDAKIKTVSDDLRDNYCKKDSVDTLLRDAVQKITQQITTEVLNTAHPVGSVLEMDGSQNPGDLIGGTWVQLEAREGAFTLWKRAE